MQTIERREEPEIVNIGDHAKCPQCSRIGRVIWVSQDGKRAGIRCPASHRQMSRGESNLGSTMRPQTKSEKNMVFLMETALIATVFSTQR